MKTIDELYRHLRKLVSDQFAITLKDKDFRDNPTVILSPSGSKSHPWTRFEGKTIEDAFQRAINKLEKPAKDYLALDGFLWKAQEESCYCEEHIKLFLVAKEDVQSQEKEKGIEL